MLGPLVLESSRGVPGELGLEILEQRGVLVRREPAGDLDPVENASTWGNVRYRVRYAVAAVAHPDARAAVEQYLVDGERLQ